MKKILILILISIPILLMSLDVTFSFANGVASQEGDIGYYDFDVMAQVGANVDNRFWAGMIYFDYSTAVFNTYAVSAGNLVVTRGTGLPSGVYTTFGASDNTSSRIAVSWITDVLSNGTILTTTPQQMIHCRFKIANYGSNTGLSFYLGSGGTGMSGNQFYTTSPYTYDQLDEYACYVGSSLNEYMPDPTLPVELSSFTAIATPQNFVRLDWVTQSETGVLGFYIYRNVIDNLNSAEVVSPLLTATNTSQETSYSYTDREIQDTGTYYYWLQNQDINGSYEFHGPISVSIQYNDNSTPVIPLVTQLKIPYPNPFNPNVTIAFDLAKASRVSINVYNNKGQLIRTMLDSMKNPGISRLVWDGTDNLGENMPSGVYFIKMQAGNYTKSQKVILMK